MMPRRVLKMDDAEYHFARTLAELLRIQRWAGGDSVSADRIFGLMHGFETVLRQERTSFGIAADKQEKIEHLLEEIESGSQSADCLSIKDRLRRDGITDTEAACVMNFCRLQSRFIDGIEQVMQGRGKGFSSLGNAQLPEQEWVGALHYMELFDATEGAHKKMHAVFAPAVPRVGECVTPQGGSRMRVIAVDHVVLIQGRSEGHAQPCLVPHVILESLDEDSG